MVRVVSLAAVVSLSLMLAGCKDDFESLTKKASAKTQEAVDVLKTVKDKASADAAATKLKSLGDDMKDIERRISALPQPTEAEAKKMMESSESSFKKMGEVTQELLKETMRIQGAGLMTPNLQTALSGMK